MKKSEPGPFPFLCFDTEDNSKELMSQPGRESAFDKKVTQIAAITAEGKKYYSPGNVKDFKRWLIQQGQAGIRWVYSLNIKYDLGALFADTLDELDQTLVGGRVIKAVWGNIIFVDVFNIWPMSVKRLGLTFGLKKLETDSMSTDKEYVFRDVEIIWQAMLFAWRFATDLGLKFCPATLGSLGIALWRSWGGNNCHDSVGGRDALFGGRVELFKRENESKTICWTDINSLYPHVLCGKFPGPLNEWRQKKWPAFGLVRCTVKVPEMELCPLPFRRDDGMVFYPYGTFSGMWTIVELENAVVCGAKIIKKHEVFGTNSFSYPYKSYIERLYEMRKTGPPAPSPENEFYKRLMATLYGRLGSTGRISRTVWQTEKNCKSGIPFGEKVLLDVHMPLSEEVNWPHCAYCTAYARLETLSYMQKIGAERMIYCDTDSTIFDASRKSLKSIPFPTGPDLGQMKLVSWERECETYAPKMYHIGDTWKAKGVPVRLAREFIQQGHVEYDLPYQMREAITFFDRGNIRKLAVWHRVTKERKTDYDKKKLIGNRYFPCKIYTP